MLVLGLHHNFRQRMFNEPNVSASGHQQVRWQRILINRKRREIERESRKEYSAWTSTVAYGPKCYAFPQTRTLRRYGCWQSLFNDVIGTLCWTELRGLTSFPLFHTANTHSRVRVYIGSCGWSTIPRLRDNVFLWLPSVHVYHIIA